MPNWTSEQLRAINEEGTNIIVSAGAGSGKTAVLTERVIRKLKNGISINELLVLTFTNKAASEMKERIRVSLNNEEDLKEQLDLLDASYITTFDSYALSLVKKYHYLINVSPHLKIIDKFIMDIKKEEILDSIFEDLYNKKDTLFLKLIGDFCVKNDDTIKNNILNIYNKMGLLINKKEYLSSYLDINYDNDNINKDIDKYVSLIIEKVDDIKNKVESINEDTNYYELIYSSLNNLFNSTDYNSIKSNIDIKLPRLPNNSDESLKCKKEEINSILKIIKDLCKYKDIDEIRSNINLTYDYVKVIIDIISKLDEQISLYKDKYDVYEFMDIALMSIRILEENREVSGYLKNSIKEIMIDEYQDTSDIQEYFINLISNNNVYMVGDIKQSIYRFRNANPYIFKNKYDTYSNCSLGYKIDLNKNFRTRKESINSINKIFDLIMNENRGGANYKESHRLEFGNINYEEKGLTNYNQNLEIYNYDYDKNNEFTKEEIEAFIIGNDIKKKINSGYKVLDKDGLRSIKYSDFAILMDRSTNFDLYKRIFTYLNIPLNVHTDENIINEYDVIILKNIIKLIIFIKDGIYDNEFKHLFMSIGRSYLFEYDDELLFDYITNNINLFESDLYKICSDISKSLDNKSISAIISIIIDKFKIYENIIKIGDINNVLSRLEYLSTLGSNLSMLGYTIYDYNNLIDKIINNNIDIKYTVNDEEEDAINIMTIHKSKGLEYSICYYSGLYAEFNMLDIKDKFMFGINKIITPYFDEGIGTTIYKYMMKDYYLKEEVSEKIRLFYVALTRAKEKMIMVTSLSTKEGNDEYRSLNDILISIRSYLDEYIVNVEVDVTNDYKLTRNNNYKDKIKIVNKEIIKKSINIENNIIDKKKFSKNINKLITDKEKEIMKRGSYFHYLLEIIDFKNPNLNNLDINEYEKKHIDNFLNNKIFDDLKNSNIYKEYPFSYIENSITYNGVIDLIIEKDDVIYIIDYKLSNIEDSAYIEQLKGYERYIKLKSEKQVKLYLYSIMEERWKEIL